MKIDLRNVPDAEVSGIDLANVDITVPAPETEPQRQYYFMALLKQQLVPERAKQNGKEYLTACITTFGCQMNARDSEKLEGILETVGYHIVETEDADFVVYNTCTVRENANLRVYGRLGQLGKYKKKNPGMIISLCGCMMQEPLVVEKLKKSYHFVNAGHLPTHLADSYPQLRQKNAFFNLAIAGRNGLFDEEAVNVVAVRVDQQREQDDDAEELRPFEEFIARSSPGDYFDQ